MATPGAISSPADPAHHPGQPLQGLEQSPVGLLRRRNGAVADLDPRRRLDFGSECNQGLTATFAGSNLAVALLP